MPLSGKGDKRNARRSWDDLCKRCGFCCLEKRFTSAGTLYIDARRPCRFLDTKTNGCRVYDRRFIECRECKKLRLWHALFASYLPDSCGYVEKFRIWRVFSRSLRTRRTSRTSPDRLPKRED